VTRPRRCAHDGVAERQPEQVAGVDSWVDASDDVDLLVREERDLRHVVLRVRRAKRALLATNSSKFVIPSMLGRRRRGRDSRYGHRALAWAKPVQRGRCARGRPSGDAQLAGQMRAQGGRTAESAAYGNVMDVRGRGFQ